MDGDAADNYEAETQIAEENKCSYEEQVSEDNFVKVYQ